MSNELQGLILETFTDRETMEVVEELRADQDMGPILTVHQVQDAGERAFYTACAEYEPLHHAVTTFWATYDARASSFPDAPEPWGELAEWGLGHLLLDLVCIRGTLETMVSTSVGHMLDEYREHDPARRAWALAVLSDDVMRAALHLVWAAYDLGRALGAIPEQEPWG